MNKLTRKKPRRKIVITPDVSKMSWREFGEMCNAIEQSRYDEWLNNYEGGR